MIAKLLLQNTVFVIALGALLFTSAGTSTAFIMGVFVGVPLLLGSWWGAAIAPVFAILFAIRARIEERALIEGLPDYADYAAHVRYHPVPGLW